MPRIEPALVPVVSDLARGLRELDVPFGVVGALLPELIVPAMLDARGHIMPIDDDRTSIFDHFRWYPSGGGR